MPAMSLMKCPYCQSQHLQNRKRSTDLGYLMFRCSDCGRKSNERTGTPFNFLEFPTDIVFEILLCRLRYKLSLRNLAEMFLLRGFQFTHEAVRDWEARFAPLLAEHLRRRRKGKVGSRWYADETYIKVKGKWCYLYRAIDGAGNLVDSLLSATRDMAAAQRFFRSALSIIEKDPAQITTDGHASYPRAIDEVLGSKVKHRCSAYKNRRIEQDHRGIKQRYYPMLGFGSLPCARRFCRAFEEVRQYFRPRRKRNQFVSLAKQRSQFVSKALTLAYLFEAA
jgi:putative transposase